MKVLSKSDASLAREVDKTVKNKFRFEWLETAVVLKSKKLGEVKVELMDCIEKIDVAGKAKCSYCQDVISYGSKGRVALTDHVKSEKHLKEVEHRKSNYILGSQFAPKAPSQTPLFPLFRNLQSKPVCDTSSSASVETNVSVSATPAAEKLIPVEDRSKNMEAMILSVMAENNISFAVAPELVKLIQECARDPKALANVSLNRITAAYKLKYGLADYFKEAIVSCMRQCPFSLSLDEATSSNNKKVLAVLVSYFSPVKMEVVVEHFASIGLVKTDSAAIFEAVKELIY